MTRRFTTIRLRYNDNATDTICDPISNYSSPGTCTELVEVRERLGEGLYATQIYHQYPYLLNPELKVNLFYTYSENFYYICTLNYA